MKHSILYQIAVSGLPFRLAGRLPCKVFILICLLNQSCVYRFTNLHMKAPEGAKTIAIEAVYDTGKTVLPHEILWEELQKQFAINGKLKLAPASEADLYLRAHIMRSSISPTSTEKVRTTEPDSFYSSGSPPMPWRPQEYPNYNVASSYSKTETLSLSLEVEVWNLHTRKKIFRDVYSGGETWTVYDGSLPPEFAFLKAEESFEEAFEGLSFGLARAIVRDVLTRT